MNWLGISIAKAVTNEITKSSREKSAEQSRKEREERERADPILRYERIQREKKEKLESILAPIISIGLVICFCIWLFSNVS